MTLAESRKRTRSTMSVVPWLVIDRMVEGKHKPAVIIGYNRSESPGPITSYVKIQDKVFRYDSIDLALKSIGRTKSDTVKVNLTDRGFHRFNSGVTLYTWAKVPGLE